MFRFAQHDREFISLRKASDNSDTNHFETAHSDRTFSSIQKFSELRIACSDLLGFRKFMVGQVITPAERDRQID